MNGYESSDCEDAVQSSNEGMVLTINGHGEEALPDYVLHYDRSTWTMEAWNMYQQVELLVPEVFTEEWYEFADNLDAEGNTLYNREFWEKFCNQLYDSRSDTFIKVVEPSIEVWDKLYHLSDLIGHSQLHERMIKFTGYDKVIYQRYYLI